MNLSECGLHQLPSHPTGDCSCRLVNLVSLARDERKRGLISWLVGGFTSLEKNSQWVQSCQVNLEHTIRNHLRGPWAMSGWNPILVWICMDVDR